jgi:hypothetical protein
MTGREVLGLLKQHPKNARIPVTESEEGRSIVALGAAAYVSKVETDLAQWGSKSPQHRCHGLGKG